MKAVKITAMRKTEYCDLIEKYELPIESPCTIGEGDVFYFTGEGAPNGLCDSAWESMRQFAESIFCGKGGFFGGWLKDDLSAMISCNDGFRPVSFLLELTEID